MTIEQVRNMTDEALGEWCAEWLDFKMCMASCGLYFYNVYQLPNGNSIAVKDWSPCQNLTQAHKWLLPKIKELGLERDFMVALACVLWPHNKPSDFDTKPLPGAIDGVAGWEMFTASSRQIVEACVLAVKGAESANDPG